MNTHDGNMDDESILERYKLANLSVIVGMDRNVFASLMDIPRLVKEREELNKRIKELEKAK